MWKFHPYRWWQTQRNKAFLVRSQRLTMEGWWGFDNLFLFFSLSFISPLLDICWFVKEIKMSYYFVFVSKVVLILLIAIFFALDPFLKLNFIFNFILRYWLVNKLGFMTFFMGWFWSHDLSHGFERLTQVDINLFLYYFLHVFYFSISSFNIRFI